jgi:hypothetical protein
MSILRVTARLVRRLPGGSSLVRGIARKVFGGDATDQWARVVLNREVRAVVRSLRPEGLDALEISGNFWKSPEWPFRSYTSVSWPEYDVCARTLGEAAFDLILAEQVFEHLLWPYRAARNVYAMLRPGGYFLISTPFLLKIHLCPVDCSRWTETGLQYLLAEAGFTLDAIKTGSWGNRACVVANFSRWEVFNSTRHSLENEADFPIVVWALARKGH